MNSLTCHIHITTRTYRGDMQTDSVVNNIWKTLNQSANTFGTYSGWFDWEKKERSIMLFSWSEGQSVRHSVNHWVRTLHSQLIQRWCRGIGVACEISVLWWWPTLIPLSLSVTRSPIFGGGFIANKNKVRSGIICPNQIQTMADLSKQRQGQTLHCSGQ